MDEPRMKTGEEQTGEDKMGLVACMDKDGNKLDVMFRWSEKQWRRKFKISYFVELRSFKRESNNVIIIPENTKYNKPKVRVASVAMYTLNIILDYL